LNVRLRNLMLSLPTWLSGALFEDAIDWGAVDPVDPLQFRQFVTLHDSGQVAVLIDSAVDGYIQVVVRWDTYWNKDILPYPGDDADDWPFLIVRIDGVSKIEISDFDPVATDSRAISDLEPEKTPEGFRTRLMDVYGGKIDFDHTGQFRLALFSAAGERLTIKPAEQDGAGQPPTRSEFK